MIILLKISAKEGWSSTMRIFFRLRFSIKGLVLLGVIYSIATGVPVPELLTFFKEVHCHRLISTRRQSNAGTAAQLDAHVYKLAQKYRELLLGQVSKYPILYLK